MAPNNVSGSGRRIGYISTQYCCWDDLKDYKINALKMYTNKYEHKYIYEINMLNTVCLWALRHVLVCDAELCIKVASQLFSHHDAFETIPSSINEYNAAHGRLWPCVAVADPGKTLQDCGWIGPCHFSRREPRWLSAGSCEFGERE